MRIPALVATAIALAFGVARGGDERPDSSAEQPAPAADGLFSASRWRANVQTTAIYQYKPPFGADYTGPNSLLPQAENGYSVSLTLYLGFRPWTGAEFFFNPELFTSLPLSTLHGLGGLSNSENQKGSSTNVQVYSARAFLRQTIPLGGEPLPIEAGPNQFATTVTSRRVVLTVGQMALIDFFDNNAFAHDGRTQFMNWALLAYGASDYAADARGYTWGLVGEYYHDAWAVRFGTFAQPINSNGLALDVNIFEHFGDDLEIEHDHVIGGLVGKIRVLGFVNRARMASFDDALAYARIHGGTPSFAAVRMNQVKLGFGINGEQYLAPDLGVFGRFSWNDGRTETYAFAEIDLSATAGAAMKGRRWCRPDDTAALAVVLNGISDPHQQYLGAGGLGNFIGDGRLNYRPEGIIESYYSLRAFTFVWLSAGIQFIVDPAYNADRGPAFFYSARAHVEY